MNKIQAATYYLGLLLCLMSGLLLEACSSDSASDSRPDNSSSERTVRLSAGARQYHVDDAEMASAPGLTRTVYPGTDWTPITPTDNMLVFVTKEKDSPTASDVLSRIFYSTTSGWQSNITITDAGPDNNYLIYGFMPIDAENVSISLLSPATNYKAGAKMSIKGLKVLTQTDPCVIVGVGKLETSTSDVTLKWGTFDFTFKEGTSDVIDYMSILLDHIYSRYYFQVKIDADYAQLRTIKITKMTLEALSNDGTQTVGTVNATVNIQTNTTNTNPISSVTYSRNTGTRSVTFFENTTTPLSLTTSYQDAGFCLAPGDQRWFRLTTVYEVYNRDNKHIRTNTATNTFDTANFKEHKITNTNPGLDHTIQIIVNPTYLYVLSDSDLDTPTITIN
jgi:hypothetical protein